MDTEMLAVIAEINRAVIKFRGVYSVWSKKHGISYNEMLVLYTIRDNGFCTQKQICESYLLPRQTINHVIIDMRERGLLKLSPENCTGREKAFVLSDEGKKYAAPFLKSLEGIENKAIDIIGQENVRAAAEAIKKYSAALEMALFHT